MVSVTEAPAKILHTVCKRMAPRLHLAGLIWVSSQADGHGGHHE